MRGLLYNHGAMPVNLMGIDPGTRTMGIANICFDARDGHIIRTDAMTLFAERLWLDELLGGSHGQSYARLKAIGNFLHDELFEREPIAVYCESPFYSANTPTAFAPLVQTVMTIKDALSDYDKMMKLELVSPSMVKAAMGVSGSSKKAPMLQAITSRVKDIHLYQDIETLDNNAIDAVAIALAGYTRYLSFPKVMVM